MPMPRPPHDKPPHPRPVTLLGHARRNGRLVPRPTPAPALDAQRQAELEQEFQLARDIQQGLLLEAVPRLPGWEISAVSLPARVLGGDLYDFLPLGGGRHGLMIGDVSGKGLPAALRMAVARTVFRHEARRGEPPGATLAGVNRGILREIPQGMITMLYATVDLRGGELRIANAGHNFPVLIGRSVAELELTGLPLGVDGDSEYEECRVVLDHGETIVLYTDGVVEATAADEQMFGYERLAALLVAQAALRPRALLAALLHELRAWSGGRQADDITMVIVRRRLAQAGAELQGVAREVLGAARAAEVLHAADAPPADAPAEVWAAALPEIARAVQARYGRGLARELHGQLRLALEEFREGSE
jgi:sigma-B regulation protein RsbU (phosphoserine phosphatase)